MLMSVRRLFSVFLFFLPPALQASFIESTMGTAVVNDATATYHNPAALTLFKTSQFIALGSLADISSNFTGKSLSPLTPSVQSGHTKIHGTYDLPSLYMSTPIQNQGRIGIAIVSNSLNSSLDETSILRYTQPNTQLHSLDAMPGFALQLNDYLSLGLGLNYSYARFTSNPITGFPALNLPDSQSHNVASDSSYGGNAGFVIKPARSTLLGFNYRSAVSYQFSGRSQLKGVPSLTSNQYNFDYWTPARSVLTLSHFITSDLGFISTLQRVQWSIFKSSVVHGVVTQTGTHAIIVPEVIVPYHFHDTWTYTLGGIKKVTPTWVVRVAGTYDQSPSHGNYKITSGDSFVLGASSGYEIYKNWFIDGSYAHVFVKNQPINIASKSNRITGVNKTVGNSVSIKLTVNL
ncbi:MAG: OmpP1/FadL family transporter [Legionellaceae bacterium]